MTIVTTPPVEAPGARRQSAYEGGPVTLGNVVRSEWIKFWSLRSTVITLALTALSMVGLGVLICSFVRPQETIDPINRSLVGVHIAMLTIGVLGVLTISGEYGTGMIRATLGAVPRRLPVLWAKAIVFAPIAFVLSFISALIAFLAGQAVLGSAQGVSLGAPGALRSIFGVALFLTVMGLLGLGLGFLIRSTAGGIAALVGVTLVLQGVAAALPTSWQNTVVPYFPLQAGQAVYLAHHDVNTLQPWPGFAVFCGYAAASIIAAALFLRRRDA